MSKPYNGHASWAQWNISLLLHKDEGLYRMCQTARKRYSNARDAARWLLVQLPDKTPDGAVYSFTGVRNALRGFE